MRIGVIFLNGEGRIKGYIPVQEKFKIWLDFRFKENNYFITMPFDHSYQPSRYQVSLDAQAIE